MTALSRARLDHAITDEIHAMMMLYPSKANDDAWIVAEVAEAHGRDPADVRRVWADRFEIKGAN